MSLFKMPHRPAPRVYVRPRRVGRYRALMRAGFELALVGRSDKYLVGRVLAGLYVRRWDRGAAVWTDDVRLALVHTYADALARIEDNRIWRGLDAVLDKAVLPLSVKVPRSLTIRLTA